MAREKNAYQILRIDGKNVFVEVMSSAFPIGKIQLNFVEYDETTKKQKRILDFYIDIPKALVLSNDILLGKFQETVKEAIDKKSFNGMIVNDFTSFYTNMGGTGSEKVESKLSELQVKHPWLKSGMAISKQIKIQKGKKVPWILRGDYGPGKENDTGLIVPNGKSEEAINIPLTEENLKEIATIIQTHLSGYYSGYYARYGTELFKDKPNIYKKEA